MALRKLLYSSFVKEHSLRCLSISSDPSKIPLTDAIPGLTKPIYALPTSYQETKVTELSNGLRVASQNKFGQFCTVGVVIDSGSRYEVAFPSGIAHFLEKLAFNSTSQFENKNSILLELERHGGICDCQGSRDTTVYAASADSRGLDQVINLLSEAVLQPKLTLDEMEKARQTIQYELEDIGRRPDQEAILFEMIHAAAYRDNTLGLPKLCPPENIYAIDRSILYTYLKLYYTPSRMVVAGVGVDHDALVRSTEKYFVEKKPIWETESSIVIPTNIAADKSHAQYTGGLVKIEKDLTSDSVGPLAVPELVHFVLGLESSSHQDPDFIPFCVLNMMMGGGGSFSAGGPGKGMYTRLYTNVLNRYHWMYNATAYNHAYNDTGLFCIHASAPPNQLKDIVGVIVKEFANMTGRISQNELDRAKTQLQSMLLMNLEARPIVFEDVGRQVLATGFRRQPEFFIEEIAKVSEADIQRIATRMLRSKAAVVALGKTQSLPFLEDIESGLGDKEGKLPRKFSLFR